MLCFAAAIAVVIKTLYVADHGPCIVCYREIYYGRKEGR
jgi:hypothetical protein